MARADQAVGSVHRAAFTDDRLPVTGERHEVAGVGTYVLRADGVPDGDTTPIYLDMHDGALIFGAGD